MSSSTYNRTFLLPIWWHTTEVIYPYPGHMQCKDPKTHRVHLSMAPLPASSPKFITLVAYYPGHMQCKDPKTHLHHSISPSPASSPKFRTCWKYKPESERLRSPCYFTHSDSGLFSHPSGILLILRSSTQVIVICSVRVIL